MFDEIKSALIWKPDQIQLSLQIRVFRLWALISFLLYAIHCISVHFVALSGLLINSIWSLKCYYEYPVIISIQMQLVQKAERHPTVWKTKTLIMEGRLSEVLGKKRILTSLLSRNLQITSHVQ